MHEVPQVLRLDMDAARRGDAGIIQKYAGVIARYALDSSETVSRLDAATRIFFARQLEDIDKEMYEIRYARLEALELVYTKQGISPGAESHTFRMFDKFGFARFISDYSTGVPRVDIGGIEYNTRIRSAADGYGYSLQEIRAAAEAGLPLDSMRAATARRALNELLNQSALIGSTEFGLLGLFNQPNVPIYTVPNGGTSGSTLWMGDTTQTLASKTAQEIINDLFGAVDAIPTATLEVEHPRRVCLPYKLFRYISRTVLAVGTTPLVTTVLEFFNKNRPGIEVRGALYLDTQGLSGNHYTGVAGNAPTRAMAYDPDRRNVELVFPIPFESLPPERRGFEWNIINHARIGSVIYRYPASAIYFDGI